MKIKEQEETSPTYFVHKNKYKNRNKKPYEHNTSPVKERIINGQDSIKSILLNKRPSI